MLYPALVIGLLAGAGCGRLRFDRSDAHDADAALPPFGPARPLSELGSPTEEDDPTLTGDGLEIYFQSRRLGTRDIFVATRASIDEPFGAPALVAELSTPDEDDAPEVTADGLVMLLGSDRPGGAGDYDIYLSTRASRADPWQPPVRIAELSSPMHELSAVLASSRLEVIVHSERPGGLGGRDLYRATRSSTTEPFGPLANLSAINSAVYDGNPILIDGDRQLWFDSDRDGAQRDLFVAERPSADTPELGPPRPIAELNTAADESDPWLSEDGRWIVFASDRGGEFELYEARR